MTQLDFTSHSLILHQCREPVQFFAIIKAAVSRMTSAGFLPGYSRRIPCSAGCFCALIKQLTLLGRGTAISGSHPFCGSAVWYHPQCHYLHPSRPLVFDISLVVPH